MKLKNLLKMMALASMAVFGGCSANQKENKQSESTSSEVKQNETIEQERKKYFGLTKEEFRRCEISEKEALSRIIYEKGNRAPLKQEKQR